MNAAAVLEYGHQEVLRAIDGLSADQQEQAMVCGYWSVKDILAHLDCYEHLLLEMAGLLLEEEPGPYLRQQMEQGDDFNDKQVAGYHNLGADQVLAAYQQTYLEAKDKVERIPTELINRVGTIPAYGLDYAFDDMLVYQYYGHKREHSAQIAVFKDSLAG